MNAMIENYINGNLQDAKKQAKRFGFVAVLNGLRLRLSWKAKERSRRHVMPNTASARCRRVPLSGL